MQKYNLYLYNYIYQIHFYIQGFNTLMNDIIVHEYWAQNVKFC